MSPSEALRAPRERLVEWLLQTTSFTMQDFAGVPTNILRDLVLTKMKEMYPRKDMLK